MSNEETSTEVNKGAVAVTAVSAGSLASPESPAHTVTDSSAAGRAHDDLSGVPGFERSGALASYDGRGPVLGLSVDVNDASTDTKRERGGLSGAASGFAVDALADHVYDRPHGTRVNAMRLVTFNIKRFHCGVELVARAIRDLNATVAALQEVTDTGFAQLSASLPEYDAAFFGHVRGGKYGNAVLSLHPIVSRQEVHLRGGSVVTLPAGAKKFLGGVVGAHGSRHRITRGMLVCEIDIDMGGGDERVTVAATHLDHMSRAERLVQLTHVVEELGLHRRPVVLLGDLNTLRRSDYCDREWAALSARAAERGWSPPQDGGLEILERAGMVDLGGHVSQTLRTAPTSSPMYRIDYVFGSPVFFEAWHVASASVAESVTCSDHHPLVVDVRRRTSRSPSPL